MLQCWIGFLFTQWFLGDCCCCFFNNISLPVLDWISSLLPVPQFCFCFLSGVHWLFSKSVRLFLFGKEVHLYPLLDPSYKWYLTLISLPVSLTSLAMIISALFPEASHGILSCLLWLSDGSSSMYPIFFIPYGRLCLQIFFPILKTVFLFHLGFLWCANAFKVNQSCFLSFGSFFIILGTLGGIDVAAYPPYIVLKIA